VIIRCKQTIRADEAKFIERTSGSKEISIIVPTYNAEKTICTTLNSIKNIINSTLRTYELIVVNDGSIDNTREVLQNEQKLDKNIQIISYTQNKGKGYATKVGVMESNGKTIIFVDSDSFRNYNKLEDCINDLETCDIVIGSKRHPMSRVYASMYRKFLSRTFNVLVRMAIGIKIRDTQSGLKAGRGDVVRKIFRAMLVERYAFDVELLTIATLLNLKITEIPIDVELGNRFRVREIVKMLIDLGAVCYRYRIKKRYQKQLEKERTTS
jgi:dolichol-phosphate mannosyltransferase